MNTVRHGLGTACENRPFHPKDDAHQWHFYPYHNDESLCFPDKNMAAKERKEHEGNLFHLCVLCVLSRQFPVVAAQAALGQSVFICGLIFT
jgi:hypothetical protein